MNCNDNDFSTQFLSKLESCTSPDEVKNSVFEYVMSDSTRNVAEIFGPQIRRKYKELKARRLIDNICMGDTKISCNKTKPTQAMSQCKPVSCVVPCSEDQIIAKATAKLELTKRLRTVIEDYIRELGADKTTIRMIRKLITKTFDADTYKQNKVFVKEVAATMVEEFENENDLIDQLEDMKIQLLEKKVEDPKMSKWKASGSRSRVKVPSIMLDKKHRKDLALLDNQELCVLNDLKRMSKLLGLRCASRSKATIISKIIMYKIENNKDRKFIRLLLAESKPNSVELVESKSARDVKLVIRLPGSLSQSIKDKMTRVLQGNRESIVTYIKDELYEHTDQRIACNSTFDTMARFIMHILLKIERQEMDDSPPLILMVDGDGDNDESDIDIQLGDIEDDSEVYVDEKDQVGRPSPCNPGPYDFIDESSSTLCNPDQKQATPFAEQCSDNVEPSVNECPIRPFVNDDSDVNRLELDSLLANAFGIL